MRNILFLALATFGLAFGTVQAGTLSVQSPLLQYKTDLSDLQISQETIDYFIDCIEQNAASIEKADDVIKIYAKTDDPRASLAMELRLHEASNGTVIVVTDHFNFVRTIFFYSDKDDVPDITTVEGLAMLAAQYDALRQFEQNQDSF